MSDSDTPRGKIEPFDEDEAHDTLLHGGLALTQTGYVDGCTRCEWLKSNERKPLSEYYMEATNRICELETLCADMMKTMQAIVDRYDDALTVNPNASELSKGCSTGSHHILNKALAKARAIIGGTE